MRVMSSLSAHISGPPTDLAGAILTVDLNAIQENWKRLAAKAAPAECGAAVKGNAYGLGVDQVAAALWAAGCRTFFVARPMEGGELRALLPREAIVYVLDGLFPGQAEFYAREDLRPALITIEEAREWAAFGTEYGRNLPCAIHVDTVLAKFAGVEDKNAQPQSHPVVRTHPVTRRKSLFVNPLFTQHFDGMSREESAGLLDYLYKHITRYEFVYRHRWQTSDIVMWDNRCTLHYAVHDYGDEKRVLHRTTIVGGKPS